MAASWLAIFKTRFELLTLELEEEGARLFSYLFLSLLAFFFFCLAILLVVLLVVILCWDTYRIAAIAGLSGLFGLLALVIGLSVHNSYRNKPRLFAATLSELKKDVDAFGPGAEVEASDE